MVAKVKNKSNSMDIGIFLILILLIIFIGRCIHIVRNNNERGGLAYVQLLNFSLPIVEEQIYNEEAYYENNFSIKNICMEALGLSNLTPLTLVKSEVPFLKGEVEFESGELSMVTPFELNEGAVSKYSDEERKNLYNPKLKKELDKSKLEVLIYHTHSSENYFEYKKPTSDVNHNVIGVGNVITKELEENYGISVIHDKTIHDISYNSSYNRSRETVKKYYDKFGDKFKLVIDIHRDGVDLRKATSKTKDVFTTEINGQKMAKIMYVNSRSSSKFKSNSKVEEKISKITKDLYPGLSRDTLTYNNGINSFNQDIFSNSILIEVGSNLNTSEEAKTSAKYIARVIAEYINGK